MSGYLTGRESGVCWTGVTHVKWELEVKDKKTDKLLKSLQNPRRRSGLNAHRRVCGTNKLLFSAANAQKVLPLAKVALEAHALGDLEG